MACMETLSGNWTISGLPVEWELKSFTLNSSGIQVNGTAEFIIGDELVSFSVWGNYDDTVLGLSFSIETNQINFVFVGNCAGDNVFKGAIQGMVANMIVIRGEGTITQLS